MTVDESEMSAMVNALLRAVMKPDRSVKRIRRQLNIRRRAGRSPCQVVVGASKMIPEGWIGTEIEDVNLLQQDTWTRFFRDDSIDAILAEHVWEHLSPEDGLLAAQNCFRFLKPGGFLRVAVPDGLSPDKDYIEQVRPGGNGPGCDDHRVLYNYRTFSAVFSAAGFETSLLEHFDEGGQFHFTDWDPERGPIRRSKRFDPRNRAGRLRYTSLILDAHKPVEAS